MCMWENRASGLLKVPIVDFVYRWILHCWHFRHVETHSRMSAFMLGQTKRSAMSLTEARLLGCDNPCKCRNTCFRNAEADVRPWVGLADVTVQPSITEGYWELLKFQGGVRFHLL